MLKRGGGVLVESAPTLAEKSVRLLRVVLLPEEGLPTRAMRGSRGIFSIVCLCPQASMGAGTCR